MKKRKKIIPGQSPGTFNIPTDALKPKVYSLHYNADDFSEAELPGFAEIEKKILQFPSHVHWFDIRGFGDKALFEQMATYFRLHRLEMEDVFNIYQRPKVEDYADHLFFVSRIISESETDMVNDQLSLFLTKNTVITIRENYTEHFETVKERIRKSKGYIRQQGADYLSYAIMDSAIDMFFPLLEKMGDKMDDLEDELITNPERSSLNKILRNKRELIVLRRTIFQERDKINDVLRSNYALISEGTRVYFRDAYDHCIQVNDMVDSYREVTSSMMDVYLSSVSNKLNQVMKVLTIISTIFIPLSFIVGVYGMNFSRENPDTGEKMPLNMPELFLPYGYPGVMLFMALIVGLQLYLFYRKGWLFRNDN